MKRGRKEGTKFVNNENRKKVTMYLPKNVAELLKIAKKEKDIGESFLVNSILLASTKTETLENGLFRHSLSFKGKEIVSLTNDRPNDTQVTFQQSKHL